MYTRTPQLKQNGLVEFCCPVLLSRDTRRLSDRTKVCATTKRTDHRTFLPRLSSRTTTSGTVMSELEYDEADDRAKIRPL
jgi:hypothetical protein